MSGFVRYEVLAPGSGYLDKDLHFWSSLMGSHDKGLYGLLEDTSVPLCGSDGTEEHLMRPETRRLVTKSGAPMAFIMRAVSIACGFSQKHLGAKNGRTDSRKSDWRLVSAIRRLLLFLSLL